MSIRQGFLFNHSSESQDNAPSSGDGASSPAAFSPITGQRNDSYEAPPVAPRLDTRGGLDSHLSRDRGSERDYREAQAASEGIHDGGSPGLALPTDVDRFHTVGGHFVDEQTGAGYGVAGEDHLVTHQANLPPGTNEQSAGKAI